MTVVRCRCSHAKGQHSGGTGNCGSTPCGCASFRPQDAKDGPASRCSVSDLPVSGCAHCRGDRSGPPGPDRLTSDDIGARFEANYDGGCGNCDGRIAEGDLIAVLRDGSGYACTECLP